MTDQAIGILDAEKPRHSNAAAFAILGQFIVFGLIMGGQGVIWADVQKSLRIGDGIFGTAQFASPAIAIVLLILGGALCARLGNRILAIASMALLTASQIALARMQSVRAFVFALLLGGAGNGLLETAMNAATMDWERIARRPRMNLMHAGFSAGAVCGALGGGAILGSAMGFRAVLIALAIASALLGFVVVFVRFPPSDHHPDSAELLSAIRLILRDADLRLLALLAVLGVVGESVGFVWSVIYLRQLGAPALVSGMSFALFNGAMLCGRLINASIVARRGFRFSMALSSVTLILATILLIASHNLWPATAGFILLGLGVAGVVPTVLGRASQLAPKMPGAVSGGIMAAAYIGFIVCPPAIGWVAQATSLRVALGFIAISGAGMLVLPKGMSRTNALQSKRELA